MSFISAGFFITIAVTAIIYYLVPYKVRWYVLLIMSYAFLLTYGISCTGLICNSKCYRIFFNIEYLCLYKNNGHMRQ